MHLEDSQKKPYRIHENLRETQSIATRSIDQNNRPSLTISKRTISKKSVLHRKHENHSANVKTSPDPPRGDDACPQRRREHQLEAKQQFILSVPSQIPNDSTQPPLEDEQRGVPQQLAPRSDHQARAESHQSAWGSVLHVRHTVGAVLRSQPDPSRVPQLRETNRPQDIRPGHLAGLRQLHGEPYLLHHLQQGVQTGLQEGVALQVQEPNVETVQVGIRPRETGDRCHQGLTSAVNTTDFRPATEAEEPCSIASFNEGEERRETFENTLNIVKIWKREILKIVLYDESFQVFQK